MKSVKAHIVNSFTRDKVGGNQAGVVLDCENLSLDEKLRVASELALSETAFVLPSMNADLRLEFFTPSKQIALCGHATVATLALLRERQQIKSGALQFESIVGTHPIIVSESKNGLVLSSKSIEVYQDKQSIAASLGLLTKDIEEAWIASAGNRFLVLKLPDQLKLREVTPDFDAISRISLENNLIGYYLSVGDLRRDKLFEVRMFAPAYGIPEESATGMGAAALATVISYLKNMQDIEFKVFQGHLMAQPSPSEIHIRVNKDGRVIEVTGESKLINEKVIALV